MSSNFIEGWRNVVPYSLEESFLLWFLWSEDVLHRDFAAASNEMIEKKFAFVAVFQPFQFLPTLPSYVWTIRRLPKSNKKIISCGWINTNIRIRDATVEHFEKISFQSENLKRLSYKLKMAFFSKKSKGRIAFIQYMHMRGGVVIRVLHRRIFKNTCERKCYKTQNSVPLEILFKN